MIHKIQEIASCELIIELRYTHKITGDMHIIASYPWSDKVNVYMRTPWGTTVYDKNVSSIDEAIEEVQKWIDNDRKDARSD